ncbi:hypothetical protein D9V96_019470 [Zobellia laminariae]|uniref:hypothetical protein n=1 Tax=Zobellia laminariae TaxID=248906 RepID=UPI0012D9ACC5|nr:hypothetical protein [Zobellia laminariae]
MKKIIVIITAFICLKVNAQANNLCANGTFESETINTNDWLFYWEGERAPNNPPTQAGTTIRNQGAFFPSNPNILPVNQVHHQQQAIGPDDIVGAVLPKVHSFPIGNTTSLRLGNALVRHGKERILKDNVLITNSNSNLSFSYAMVMNDYPIDSNFSNPSHFMVTIIDSDNGTDYSNLINLGGNSNVVVTNNNPLFRSSSATPNLLPVVFKDWETVNFDLSSLIGRKITITFENKDGEFWQYFAYTYLDNICISGNDPNVSTGAIQLNVSSSKFCGSTGQICLDYSLPNGNNPSIELELLITQNGTVVNTLNSPILTSGSNYCFDINAVGLNTSLQGFDYKIIGKPNLGTFDLSPRMIGNSAEGVKQGNNNDYDFLCQPNIDCCENQLTFKQNRIEQNNYIYDTGWNHGIPLSLTTDEFTITNSSIIPITELRAVVTDIDFNYELEACATCIDNPALWASIDNVNHDRIGNSSTGLEVKDYSGSILEDKVNQREVIWQKPNGTMLNNGDKFKIAFALPPISEIPCCVTSVDICFDINYKDANCKVCTEPFCTTIELRSN